MKMRMKKAHIIEIQVNGGSVPEKVSSVVYIRFINLSCIALG